MTSAWLLKPKADGYGILKMNWLPYLTLELAEELIWAAILSEFLIKGNQGGPKYLNT